MPRVPQFTCDQLFAIFTGWSFMKDGQYLPYSDHIWQSAMTILGDKLHKDYIYQYITQNRGTINKNPETGLSYRLHGSSIPLYKPKQKTTNDKDSNWSMKAPKKKYQDLKDLRTVISLNLKQWDKLGLTLKKYKQREYEVLDDGWCDEVYYTLFEQLKLPCPFSFKNAKIDRTSGGTFLTIKGQCSECQTEIHLYSLTEPTENGIDFHISTFDTKGVVHMKKRQLRGDKRREVAQELRSKSAYLWQREQAHRRMEFGDAVPADLYSSEVLRKAKQESIEEELGLKSGDNALVSLYKLAQSPQYSGSIREVALHKPYVMYWLPEQLTMYQIFLRSDRIGSISIDGTGSVSAPLPATDGSKNPTFIYQAVTGYKEKILPLFQMASTKHDANTLAYWIREWMRSGAKAPKEVVTDFSLALLNGVTMAFNECSLQKYEDHCFSRISMSSTVEVEPLTVVRLDIAHLIKFITNWSCFSKNQPHVKDFFVRSVVLLVIQTNLEKFKKLLLAVLTVAFSPKICEHNEQDKCYKSREKLLALMKTGLSDWNLKYRSPKDDTFANLSDMNPVAHEEDKNCNERPILNFINGIAEKSKNNITSKGIDNKYACPIFGEKLVSLSRRFVLWTHIMGKLHRPGTDCEIVEIERASSARSEAYFKDLKNYILMGEKTLRLDKVVVQHLRALTGTVNLLAPNKHSKISTTSAGSSDDEYSGDKRRARNRNVSTESYESQVNSPGSKMSDSSESDSDNSTAKSSTFNDSAHAEKKSTEKYPDSLQEEPSKSSRLIEDASNSCMNFSHATSPTTHESTRTPKDSVVDSSTLNNLAHSTRENSDSLQAKQSRVFPGLNEDPSNSPINFSRAPSTTLESADNSFNVKRKRGNSPVLNGKKCMDDVLCPSDDDSVIKVNDSSSSDTFRIYPLLKRQKKCRPLYDHDLPSSTLLNSRSSSDSHHFGGVDDPVHDVSSVLIDISNTGNSYLNEVDAWGGLLTKEKEGGIYIQCCPDIENLHERPRLSKKLPLLINGNHLSLINTSRGLLKFTNTCGIDAVVHCIRVGYVDWVTYREFVNQSNTDIFDVVKVLSRRGRVQEVYKKRAELILRLSKPAGNIVDSESNIGIIIEKLVKEEPSIMTTTICSNCGHQKTRGKVVLELDLNPLYENGLMGLQESLDSYAESQMPRPCKKCCKNRTIVITYGSHLFIDVEALEWQQLATRKGYSKNYNSKFSVEEIPINLRCGKNAYKLVGAIEHTGGIEKEIAKHYKALILRSRKEPNYWQVHDGLTPNAKPYKLNKKERKQQKSIHLLFYVQNNSNKVWNSGIED